jgi:hypothetical protein
MRWACSTRWRDEKYILPNLKLKERGNLEKLGIDGKATLNLVLKK